MEDDDDAEPTPDDEEEVAWTAVAEVMALLKPLLGTMVEGFAGVFVVTEVPFAIELGLVRKDKSKSVTEKLGLA